MKNDIPSNACPDAYSCRRLTMLLFLLCLLFTPLPVKSQLQPLYFEKGVTGLGLALRALPVTGTILYVTAHPDDEDDALLFWLRRGLGMRTALMSVTRGEGGQNEIGPELFEALGVLRTEELLSVQRYLGARQFFARAFEFGYSFSVEESLEKWGKQATLGDIVRVIRQFRPLVIITLPSTGTGGGQHHQTTGLLTAEAFRAAGDPRQFPEQVAAGLAPWQPPKLYRPLSFEGSRDSGGTPIRIPLGDMDPLIGESPAEMGARARSNHRCQGMNVLPDAGERFSSYVLTDALPNLKPSPGSTEKSLFDGLDTSLMGLMQYAASEEGKVPFLRAALLSLQTTIDIADRGFKSGRYEEVADYLRQGLRNVEELKRQVIASPLSGEAKSNLLPVLENKVEDFTKSVNAACFVELDAFQIRNPKEPGRFDPEEPIPQLDGLVTRGENIFLGVRFYNRGTRPLYLQEINCQFPGLGGSGANAKAEIISGKPGVVEPHKNIQFVMRVAIPQDAPYTQPYWFRKSKAAFRYEVTDPALDGLPFAPSIISVQAGYDLADRSTPPLVRTDVVPAQYRWYDVGSAEERRMALKVVPALSISVKPGLLVVPLGKTATDRTLLVNVHNNVPGAAAAVVVLKLPQGWGCKPEATTLNFVRENEESSARFTVRIPPISVAGDHSIRAEARLASEMFDSGYQTIAYHHIQTRHLYHPAETLARSFDVKMPTGMKIGYIMGVGDEVPEALEQLGATVTLLGADDLAYSDLSGFDAVVTGIRAYKDRTDLIANNTRLLDYVKNGGNLLVQYNKYEFTRANYGPWPASISRPHDRITDENSAVKILLPDHPVFTFPNRINDEDWKGWVQERGLYFLGQWDAQYQPLLELQDPYPYNNKPKQGALIAARFGKGTWCYTGLGFFRQLPEGVPGAYRLFANLISQKRAVQKPAPGRK